MDPIHSFLFSLALVPSFIRVFDIRKECLWWLCWVHRMHSHFLHLSSIQQILRCFHISIRRSHLITVNLCIYVCARARLQRCNVQELKYDNAFAYCIHHFQNEKKTNKRAKLSKIANATATHPFGCRIVNIAQNALRFVSSSFVSENVLVHCLSSRKSAAAWMAWSTRFHAEFSSCLFHSSIPGSITTRWDAETCV